MKKILALLVALCACSVANAQNISLDLRDTPVRSALEMVFKNAGIKNFVIDNDVSGIVGRIDVKDQSVESALKLIIRANSDLLTYTIENDVYIVKKRKITSASLPVLPDMAIDLPKTNSFDVIHLNYIDPFDLQSIFGPILFISQYQRYQGGGINGMGTGGNGGFGGAGGFGNGAMGGNGGLGLGAGNGMGGGAMGGLGGMMGFQGGMGGGMGGFGGGRNF